MIKRALRFSDSLLLGVMLGLPWAAYAQPAEPAPEAPTATVAVPATETAEEATPPAPAPEAATTREPSPAPAAASSVVAATGNEDDATEVDDEGGSVPDFADLHTPDSPAFVVLGISPSEIQRPTTTRQLAVSILENFASGGDIGIPQSFALEMSPFWIAPHDDLSLPDFARSSILERLYQNMTVSIATTTEEEPENSSNSLLAFGVRTRVSERRELPCVGDVDNKLNDEVRKLLEIVDQRYADELNKLTLQLAQQGKTDAEIEAAIGKRQAEIAEEVAKQHGDEFAKLVDRCEAVVGAHPGFVLDVAFATGLMFPNGVFSDGELSRVSGWTTLGYAGLNFSALLLLKVSGLDLERDDSHVAGDAGLRLIAYFDAFAFSIEGVLRQLFEKSSVEDQTQWRVTGAVDYHAGKGVWVNVTFGRDYDDEEPDSLIALANLRFDFGDRKIQSPTNALAKQLKEQQK